MSEWDDPPIQRPRRTAAKIAFLALVAAGGAGYYAWYLRGEHQTASRGWIESRSAYEVCNKELTDLKQREAGLSDKLTTSAADREREKIERERSQQAAAQAQQDLAASRTELEDLRRQRAETEKRLGEFRDLTSKFQKMIDAGRLQVGVRDGRMLVKLPAAVLFPSGVADLSREGELALMEVAIILKQFPERKFLIAGHTDNVPLKNSTYRNNWELSTARAVKVTEFLVSAGMKPTSLAAAGYAEFDPIKSNKSDSGRTENRRIEIVLLPRIEEMPPIPTEPPPAAPATPAQPQPSPPAAPSPSPASPTPAPPAPSPSASPSK